MEQSSIDTKKLKRIRIAVFVFYFLQGLCFTSWASRIPDIKTTMGLNDASWGTILLMIPVGQAWGMALSGFLVSRLGSRRILPVAFAGYVISLILIGAAPSQYVLIICLISFGFFSNFCNISINTQGVTIEAMYNRPIMSSFHGGWSLAGLTGASIGLLMSVLHFQPFYHYLIVAAIMVAGFILNYKYLQPDIKKEKSPEDIAAKKRNKPEVFLFLIGMVGFCGMAAEGAMADWSGLYLKDVVGIPEKLAPLGLATYMITMAGGRFFIDKAAQRWGRQRIIQCGGLFISLGLFLAVIYPHPIVTLLAFMIIGLGTAGIVPSAYSIAGKKTRISTSMALTIVSSVSYLGYLMGPPVIGYVSQATSLRVSYAIIGVFGICIIIMASRIKALRD